MYMGSGKGKTRRSLSLTSGLLKRRPQSSADADGSPVIFAGRREWQENGVPHREDGADVEYADGSREWYRRGNLHRVGAPAMILADGSTSWFIDGQHHREDGPAIELSNGEKQWWWEGERVDEATVRKNFSLKRLSEATIVPPGKTTF